MVGEVVRFGDGPRARRVVLTFPLKRTAREQLAASLGTPVELVDIKVSDGTEDVVLLPSSSRQLTGKLRAAFPSATILVVEVEDQDHGVRLDGQVMRSLEAGADAYFVAHSIDELASVIDRAVMQQVTNQAQQVAALGAGEEDPLDEVLETLLRRRRAAEVEGQ